jgi:hypothetical protein
MNDEYRELQKLEARIKWRQDGVDNGRLEGADDENFNIGFDAGYAASSHRIERLEAALKLGREALQIIGSYADGSANPAAIKTTAIEALNDIAALTSEG